MTSCNTTQTSPVFPRELGAFPENKNYELFISRQSELYQRQNDIRSEFLRDYTRIIHSSAFRRLKHKTQAFFSPQSDHICTRIEHVLHVESIGYTIAQALGLNTELVRAAAVAHDLGHSPFGHKGERVLSKLSKRDLGESFWHEKNGLFFIDSIELLENAERKRKNLNLTYAVRDAVVSHCGEVDQNGLFPRTEYIDLDDFDSPNKYQPFTYEACVVKVADKISYIGRDIEDAVDLKVLNDKNLEELTALIQPYVDTRGEKLNNTIIINTLITDLCSHSNPENGIAFSRDICAMMDLIKKYNTENIYTTHRVRLADKYFELVITEIYDTLMNCYDGKNTDKLIKKLPYENLPSSFLEWLYCYRTDTKDQSLENKPIFNMESREDYCRAVITYISGMTDKYAMDTYSEIISF
ncbi:MAG: HD domain-containing protein [Ruminococcaceae bacterium]|nr:HD domain-containing protein [Oscillospiraceae bacterium]